MDENVGTLDRMTRVVFGLILLAITFTSGLTSDWVGQMLVGVGIIIGASLILSGAFARCFFYKFLGINTCQV